MEANKMNIKIIETDNPQKYIADKKKKDKISQNEAVLEILRLKNDYVSLIDISEHTAKRCNSRSYNIHSRIAELRKRGYKITNKKITKDKVIHSFYKLNGEKQ